MMQKERREELHTMHTNNRAQNKRNGPRQFYKIIASLYSPVQIYTNERSNFDCNKIKASQPKKSA